MKKLFQDHMISYGIFKFISTESKLSKLELSEILTNEDEDLYISEKKKCEGLLIQYRTELKELYDKNKEMENELMSKSLDIVETLQTYRKTRENL